MSELTPALRLISESKLLTALDLYIRGHKLPRELAGVMGLIPGGLPSPFDGYLRIFHDGCQKGDNLGLVLMRYRVVNPKAFCDFVWFLLAAGVHADSLRGAGSTDNLTQALQWAAQLTSQFGVLCAHGRSVDKLGFKRAVDVLVLSFLTDAGLPPVKALDFLAEESISGSNDIFLAIGDSTSKVGNSLSVSVAPYGDLFPTDVVASIEQGELQGLTAVALKFCAMKLLRDALSTPVAI